MKNYIVYDENDEILRTGYCGDKDFPREAVNAGERVLEGKANDVTQKVVDEKVVDKTPEEINNE